MHFGSPFSRPLLLFVGALLIVVAVALGVRGITEPAWYGLICVPLGWIGISILLGAVEGVRIDPGRSVGGWFLMRREDLAPGELVIEHGRGFVWPGESHVPLESGSGRRPDVHVFLTNHRIVCLPYGRLVPVREKAYRFPLSDITHAAKHNPPPRRLIRNTNSDWLLRGIWIALGDGSEWTIVSRHKPLADRLGRLSPSRF